MMRSPIWEATKITTIAVAIMGALLGVIYALLTFLGNVPALIVLGVVFFAVEWRSTYRRIKRQRGSA